MSHDVEIRWALISIEPWLISAGSLSDSFLGIWMHFDPSDSFVPRSLGYIQWGSFDKILTMLTPLIHRGCSRADVCSCLRYVHLDIKPANIVCFELEHTKEQGHDQSSGMML